ncbi:hypothetical protein PENSUB_4447 [Penicillium subrubescens]|uniref:Uncharacterized protein n=1 Tax=Penicillium subrubescens TaxID=1316194 RepID=A0A1Q5UCE0_9EURO|nr:hypothetical protein PENSUB_4447 [Penicillium subrubescens]
MNVLQLNCLWQPSLLSLVQQDKQEVTQVADELDLDSPICTTPDDFKSFKVGLDTPIQGGRGNV